MADGNLEFKQDVEKAVKAGSDMSHGSAEAYKALQQELEADRKKYQNTPETFDQLGQEVVKGLKYNGVADTQLEYFSKNNVGLFDATEDNKVNRKEMTPSENQNLDGFQKGMLDHFQETYESIQRRAPRDPGGALKTEFSRDDFQAMIENRNKKGTTQAAQDVVTKPQYNDQQTGAAPKLNKDVPVVPPTEAQRKQHPEKISQEQAADYKAQPRPHQELAQPQALKLPELKAGDDLVKARESYAKEVEKAVYAESHYSVQRGQGWDRIARDVLRHQGDGSHTNERNVVNLSDNIARLNGWEGRLDPNKMLHPENSVQIRDNDWIKARTEAQMKRFDEEAAKLKSGNASTDAQAPQAVKPLPQNQGHQEIKSPIVKPVPAESTSGTGHQDNIAPPPAEAKDKVKAEVKPVETNTPAPQVAQTPEANFFSPELNGGDNQTTQTAKAPEAVQPDFFSDNNQSTNTAKTGTDQGNTELAAKQAQDEANKRQQAEALVKRELAEKEKLAQQAKAAQSVQDTQVAESKKAAPSLNIAAPDTI